MGAFIPNQLNTLFVSRNEWNCKELSKFANLAKDANETNCGKDFKVEQGVCCKYFANPFNEHFNEMMKIEHLNQQYVSKNLRANCGHKINVGTNGLNLKHMAPQIDEKKYWIISAIECKKALKEVIEKIGTLIDGHRKREQHLKKNIASTIERKRMINDISKEGNLDDKNMLIKIINSLKERSFVNESIMKQKRENSENSKKLLQQKQAAKDEIVQFTKQLINDINIIKSQENDQIKEKLKLEKEVRRQFALQL